MKPYGSIKNMRKQSGFTLIELIIVIVILSALAAIITPNLINWLPKYRFKGAARDLYSNLQLAKMAAINNSANCTITYSSTGYTIAGAMTATVVLADEWGSNVRFSPTPGAITFNSRGQVPGGESDAYLSNADASIRYRIRVLISGVIQLEEQ